MVPVVGCQTGSMTPADDTDIPVSPGGGQVPGGSTAVFTMREAARVAGVSVSTLRRRRDDLAAAGAVIDSSGWQVPITALIAAGLISGEGQHHDIDDAPSAGTETATEAPGSDLGAVVRVRELEQRVQELSEQLHLWQRRAEVAEARAEERARSLDVLRVANESERLALRMLTTGTHGQTPPHTVTDAPENTATATDSAPPPTQADSSASSQRAAENAARSARRGGFLRRLFTD